MYAPMEESKKERLLSLRTLGWPRFPVYYSFGRKLKLFFEIKAVSVFWETFQLVVNVIVFGLFVWQTTQNSDHLSRPLEVLENTCLAFFLVDFLLCWYFSETTEQFVLSWESWVDVLTLVVWIEAVHVNLAFVRIARLVRLLRPRGLIDTLFPDITPLTKSMLHLMIGVIAAVLLAAGAVRMAENSTVHHHLHCMYLNSDTNWQPSCDQNAPFNEADLECDCIQEDCVAFYDYPTDLHPLGVRCKRFSYYDAVWLMVVTASTVGYGDSTPTSPWGKLVVIVCIIWFVWFVPTQVNKITEAFQGTSRFLCSYKPHKSFKYLIIAGHVTETGVLERLLKEIYSSSRLLHANIDTVVLDPSPPSDEILEVLNSFRYEQKVSYIMGSAVSGHDLKRIHAEKAAGILVLTNRSSREKQDEDSRAVLTTLVLNDFFPDIKTFSQVLLEENKELVAKTCHFFTCAAEINAGLMAINAVAPGAGTLITNLFVSTTSDERVLHKEWLREYARGLDNEAYVITIPNTTWAALDNKFEVLVVGLYTCFSVLLVGLCTSKDEKDIIINPTTVDCTKYDQAFLFCLDQSQASKVEELLKQEQFVQELLLLESMKLPPNNGSFSVPDMRTIQKNLSREDSSLIVELHKSNSPKVTHNVSTRPLPIAQIDFKADGKIIIFSEVQEARLLLRNLREREYNDTSHWRKIIILADNVSQEEEEFLKGHNIQLSSQKTFAYDSLEASSVCLVLQNRAAKESSSKFELQNDSNNLMTMLRHADHFNKGFFCVELAHENSVSVLNSAMLSHNTVHCESEAHFGRSNLPQMRGSSTPHAVKQKEAVAVLLPAARALTMSGVESDHSLSEDKNSLEHESNNPENHKKVMKDRLLAPHRPAKIRRASVNVPEKRSEVGAHRDTDQLDYNKGKPPPDCDFYMKEIYAAGRCSLPFIEDGLLAQAFFSPQSMAICNALLHGQGDSKLFLCKIPKEFFKNDQPTRFIWIFCQFLREKKCLPVGLYRAKTSINDAELSYVYTAPHALKTFVTADDKIYLFGSPQELEGVIYL